MAGRNKSSLRWSLKGSQSAAATPSTFSTGSRPSISRNHGVEPPPEDSNGEMRSRISLPYICATADGPCRQYCTSGQKAISATASSKAAAKCTVFSAGVTASPRESRAPATAPKVISAKAKGTGALCSAPSPQASATAYHQRGSRNARKVPAIASVQKKAEPESSSPAIEACQNCVELPTRKTAS